MPRLAVIIALVLLGFSPQAKALPKDLSAAVIQLADATGVLSSRSCRDGAEAGRAALALSHMLREAKRLKHIDFAEERRLRQQEIVPFIQARRGVTHSSTDCSKAREVVAGTVKTWNITLPVLSADGSAPHSAGTPSDGSLPGAPILGATRSDDLTTARKKR